MKEYIIIMQPLYKVYMRGEHSYFGGSNERERCICINPYTSQVYILYFVKGNQYEKFRLTVKENEKTTGIV